MKSKSLEDAIRAGDLEAVRELIAGGADILASSPDGGTPILLAAREGQAAIVRALAGAGAELHDLERLDLRERMQLFFKASLDRRADDDLISSEDLLRWVEKAVAEKMDPATAQAIAAHEGELLRAVRIGDLELLKEKIAAGEDVDEVRELTRDTPLTLALRERDEEMVRVLLEAGADVDFEGYGTPLGIALPDLRLAKILIEAGADLYGRGLDVRRPFERAVTRALRPGCLEDSPLLVRFFLEAGVDLASTEAVAGETLMDVELSEAWEIYNELLPHYPDKVARDHFQELPYRNESWAGPSFMQWGLDLRGAARDGDLVGVEEALARRHDERLLADVPEYREAEEAVAQDLGLALKAAIESLELPAARLLIEAGADLGVSEGYEATRPSTALASAAESWHRQSGEALRLLLDAGVPVDQRGSYGRTALMQAVFACHGHEAPLRKAIPRLLEAGADPNAVDELGLSAWSLAKAPFVEEEELARLDGERPPGPLFGSPDLSGNQSDSANKADRRRSRTARCRQALELLEAAGAEPRGEAELRLVCAAVLGDGSRVAELLKAGASPDARGPDGLPAIVAAAESGSKSAVAHLLEAGCDANARRVGRPAALEIAIGRADLELTRLLIGGGANVVMLSAMSHRVLQEAEEAGHHELVAMVRAELPPELANIDQEIENEIASDDLYYDSLDSLARAAAQGDMARVQECLAVQGIEVDTYDDLRRSMLSSAAEAGQVEMVRELIALGADVSRNNKVPGSPRSTPLICAAISPSADRGEVLKLLLEAGADPDQVGSDGRTALMHAVERDVGFFGRIGEFALSTRTLVEAGADLEVRDRYGLTAWMIAQSLVSAAQIDEASRQYGRIAELLEEAGASVEGLKELELIWAVEEGEAETVDRLLKRGADPGARRFDGATALMLAVREGSRPIARRLIEAGADVNARQWIDRGPAARDAAVDEEAHDLVRMLDEAGAEPTPEHPALRRARRMNLDDEDDLD